MSTSFVLKTKNSAPEEVYNLINQNSDNSRLLYVKRQNDTLIGKREIIYPGVITMGKKICENFPDKIYMNFSVKEIKNGIYMKNVIPEEYSEYVKGGEKIYIQNDGEIKIIIDYRICLCEPSSFMDFRCTVYNKAVESLENYILSIYESKRKLAFGRQCNYKIGSFKQLLDNY